MKCCKCGELLHDLEFYTGGKAGGKQCLNRACPRYGKRV